MTDHSIAVTVADFVRFADERDAHPGVVGLLSGRDDFAGATPAQWMQASTALLIGAAAGIEPRIMDIMLPGLLGDGPAALLSESLRNPAI